MNRRESLLALRAFGAAPRPSLAQAQQKVRRIGFLSPDSPGGTTRELFSAALKRLGYEEGRNLVIEWRWGDSRADTLPALAEDLVRHKVELIVARINGPIQAAKAATGSIPIVMLNGAFPVESGLVASLARPGGNITGTSNLSSGIVAKRLQLLKELSPRAVRVAVPWQSGVGGVMRAAHDAAAAHLGLKLAYFEASRPEEVQAMLDRIAAGAFDALLYTAFPLLRTPKNLEQAVAMALGRKLVTISDLGDFAERGGLIEFGPNVEDYMDRTASFVDRILKGARPADLPVEEPKRFILVVNLKTAKTLGITIPQAVLLRADKVIE